MLWGGSRCALRWLVGERQRRGVRRWWYICAPSLAQLCQFVTALQPEGDHSILRMKLLIVVQISHHTHLQHSYCPENIDENKTIIIIHHRNWHHRRYGQYHLRQKNKLKIYVRFKILPQITF